MPDVQATTAGRPGRLGQAEREEAGRCARRRARSTESARRARARARAASSASRARCTRPAIAAARELVGERAQEQVGVGGWVDDAAAMAADGRPAARLRRDAAAPGTPSPRGWTRERYRPLAPDLRGHGAAARRAADRLRRRAPADVLAAAPARFALCGYSMGGRVALHVALAAPERVDAARARLDDGRASRTRPSARARRAADERAGRRDRARHDRGLRATAGCAQPLFAGDAAEAARARAREDILRNDPAGLAAALRGIGTGRDDAAVGPAGRAAHARDVVVGRARREVTCARRAPGRRAARARLRVVPGAGHGLPREAPEAVARCDRRRRGPRRRGPGRWGTAIAAVRRTARSDVELAVEERPSVASPQAAASGAAPRRSARPRRSRAARRRSRRCRRSAPVARTSAACASSPLMPPQRATLRQTASATAAVSAPGSRGGLVHRDPHGDPLAHARACASTPCTGSSTSSSPAGASASIARTASSTAQAPFASRRSVDLGAGRRATAATRPASSPMPTLTFTHAKPAARGGGGLRGRLGAVLAPGSSR